MAREGANASLALAITQHRSEVFAERVGAFRRGGEEEGGALTLRAHELGSEQRARGAAQAREPHRTSAFSQAADDGLEPLPFSLRTAHALV